MELKNILPSSQKNWTPIITLNFRLQPIPGPIYMLDYRSGAQIGAAAQQTIIIHRTTGKYNFPAADKKSEKSFAPHIKRRQELTDSKYILYMYINCVLHCGLAGWLAGWGDYTTHQAHPERASARSAHTTLSLSLVQRRAILPRLTNLFFDFSKAAREL
jgi:hypothetical protein